jgi:Protein phosphatase 2C
MREAVRGASVAAHSAFSTLLNGRAFERWQSPISSLLMVEETADGVAGIDLGDSRAFALDADGAAQTAGGPTTGREAETRAAAQQTDADKPLLERTATIEMLRRGRSALNQDGAHWTFGVDPKCADHARAWSFKLARPAHVLLMTDGFAALTDQYGAYDAAGLVRAALNKGLQELGRELRAIEAQDSGGTLHPRFKKSDDATALLLRLS